MIGRASIVQGDPAKVDEVIVFVREQVQPVVDAQPGSYGLGLWVNRTTGEIVVESVWEDQSALDASEPHVTDLRAEAARRLGADSARVELHEPALVWQAGPTEPGYWSRVVSVDVPLDRLQEAIERIRAALPTLQEFPDINTVVLLVNRESGHLVFNATYSSRVALESNAERGAGLRSSLAAGIGGSEPEVTEYEVAIVGIRPPAETFG
ncbi:MAG: hypothetical protein NVSMB29_20130 [Candidatus Dormibacteria bacterium]